jgi:hypothetical protein
MNNQKGGIGLYLGLLTFTAGAFLFFGRYFDVFSPTPAQPALVVADTTPTTTSAIETTMPAESQSSAVSEPFVAHIATPSIVRAIYLTGWSAGTSRMLTRAFSIFNNGYINSVVIDIKDATGKLSYQPQDPSLLALGIGTKRISDLPALITELHSRGIYVIGRVQSFEDPFFAKLHPDYAFQNLKTDTIWTDYKGIAWLRPDVQEVWNYIAAIAIDAHAQGFDEINLDYVRYPSDGPLSQMSDRPKTSGEREAALGAFFSFLNDTLRVREHIPLSADLFGLTLSAQDDMGIGQGLTTIAPYVDWVAPMIYPSHFAVGSYGYASPSNHPYEIIAKALSDGKQKLIASGLTETEATAKLRPWLQDFDLLGVHYDASKVRAQILAAHDLGIESFLVWDPTNLYTIDAFKAAPDVETSPIVDTFEQ